MRDDELIKTPVEHTGQWGVHPAWVPQASLGTLDQVQRYMEPASGSRSTQHHVMLTYAALCSLQDVADLCSNIVMCLQSLLCKYF